MATIADEPTLDVVVGGSVSGNIDFNGDTDNITVFLVTGQTYLISLRGTGADPINDSFLQMRNPGNAIIASVTDDDGGNDLYSISTYTATATGNYTIIAATFSNPGAPDLGGWTVDVRVQGVDAVGDTNATSVFMGLGTTFGFRETGCGGSRRSIRSSPAISTATRSPWKRAISTRSRWPAAPTTRPTSPRLRSARSTRSST